MPNIRQTGVGGVLNKILLFLTPLYIITATLTFRKYLGADNVPRGTFFPEWTSVFLYVSDIVFFVLLIIWLVGSWLGKNKSRLHLNIGHWSLTIFFLLQIVRLFTDNTINVPRGTFMLYRLFQAGFIVYVLLRPKFTYWTKYIPPIVSILTVLLAIIGIMQFMNNGSLGLRFLGESILAPDMLNVAKVQTDWGVNIRAYSLMQHPNILAFVLVVGIICFSVMRKIVPRGTILIVVGVIANSVGVLLTFSRVGYLMLLFALIYYFRQLYKNVILLRQVPKGPLRGFVGQARKAFYMQIIIICLIIAIIIPILGNSMINRLTDSTDYTTDGGSVRLDSIKWGWEAFKGNWLFGVGLGNEVSYFNYAHPNELVWKYQPTHNVFLLILAEIGGVGILLIIGVLWGLTRYYKRMFHMEHSKILDILFVLLIPILALLFDHYVYTTIVGLVYTGILFAVCLPVGRSLGVGGLQGNIKFLD